MHQLANEVNCKGLQSNRCTSEVAQFLKVRKVVRGRSHWILDSPLASKSLKGTAERDTVKGNLWRPAKTERKKYHNITHNHKVEKKNCRAKKNSDLFIMKVH